MPEYVRVKVEETGAEVTVSKALAESVDGLKVLKKDAVDALGRPLASTLGDTKKTSGDAKSSANTDGGVAANTPEEASK